jgi:hypothetical protein
VKRAIVISLSVILALILAAPAALAGGATQISGVAYYADDARVHVTCDDPRGEDADYVPLVMTGDLEEGCLYTFIETSAFSPSGTYRETGRELFVSSDGASTFRTTYRFEGKYEDLNDPATEIFGRCQHPIVEGSGTGIYEGVSGTLLFKDDIEAGNFPYRGHLQY